jgi:hypothetical protein
MPIYIHSFIVLNSRQRCQEEEDNKISINHRMKRKKNKKEFKSHHNKGKLKNNKRMLMI